VDVKEYQGKRDEGWKGKMVRRETLACWRSDGKQEMLAVCMGCGVAVKSLIDD